MSEDADADTGAPAIEMHASLSTSYAEIDGMDCTSELVEAMGQGECDGDAFAMSYSDLCDDTEDDDTCDAASAGTAGSITLWIAVAAGLGATILIIFNVFGIGALPVDTQKLGMIAGIAAGALAGIAVLVWYLMLPDTDDMTLGLNVWLTITGAVTGIVAGVLAKTHGNPSA
ncbi:MAG TPA: hypothetical protein EYQ80_04720 [Candidatus Poseidoniales archaeon]|nr:hypothetical protein [Candidatus Poseidoniales archaeon]